LKGRGMCVGKRRKWEKKSRNRVRKQKKHIRKQDQFVRMETHVIETRKSLSERKFKGGR